LNSRGQILIDADIVVYIRKYNSTFAVKISQHFYTLTNQLV